MLNIGILGAGGIAAAMAKTVGQMDSVNGYAVASRDLAKAQAFSQKWNMQKAYGSYEEMLQDPNVNLVYVATPHSHHYEHARLSLEHGKHVLCEKAFTVNARQAEALFALAKEKKLLITEALWPRYMPMRHIIEDVIKSGIVGRPTMLTANFSCRICDVPRMKEPELAGGALLDLGVYPLNFAAMYFGSDPVSVSGAATLTEKGMDAQETVLLRYADGRMALVIASMIGLGQNKGVISCEKGLLEVDNLTNPRVLKVYDDSWRLIATHNAPACITGYEYEVEACVQAIENGDSECPQMPHEETLRIMRIMDDLRRQFGVKHPAQIEAV